VLRTCRRIVSQQPGWALSPNVCAASADTTSSPGRLQYHMAPTAPLRSTPPRWMSTQVEHGRGTTVMMAEVLSSTLSSPPLMPCSRDRKQPSNRRSPRTASVPGKRIRWSTIWIGTRTSVSVNGGRSCGSSTGSRLCCRRLSPSWNDLPVLQHAPWLGRLHCASILRQVGRPRSMWPPPIWA
jgi:hypothetical protein